LIAAIAEADSASSGEPDYRYRAPARALQKV
jgi:hypothetical protein